jgi:hypothetical protein
MFKQEARAYLIEAILFENSSSCKKTEECSAWWGGHKSKLGTSLRTIHLTAGVKTDRIRTDSSETVFVTILFLDSESEQIVCGYEYEIGVYR